MRKISKLAIVVGVMCLFAWSSAAFAELEFMYQKDGVNYYKAEDGRTIAQHRAVGVLPNAPDYDWWYGCSPTSVGMMMGYYDINGYGGLCYTNLVPGGEAELSNYGNPGAIANDTIASQQHINDYWPNPDAGSHTPNSLADYMGTSQDLPSPCGYPGLGGTWFYNFTDGSPFTPSDAVSNGLTTCSGMYGVYEYLQYRGYNYASLFNQYINPYHASGFTLAQYQAEIDAGRPMVIQVSGHSMFGYGYSGSTVYVRDTWSAGTHTFTWGTSYSGMTHYGVMPLTVTGGEPCGPGYDYCYNLSCFGDTVYFNIDGDNIISGYNDGAGLYEYPLTGYMFGTKFAFYVDFEESSSLAGYLWFGSTSTNSGYLVRFNKDGTVYDYRACSLSECALKGRDEDLPDAADASAKFHTPTEDSIEPQPSGAFCLDFVSPPFCDKMYVNTHTTGVIYGQADNCGGTPFAEIGFKSGNKFMLYSDFPEGGDRWGGFMVATLPTLTGSYYYTSFAGTSTFVDYYGALDLDLCTSEKETGRVSQGEAVQTE